ncbi:MAG: Gfo/Idh/MocA family oxidoreductase [Planctomycetaceae bacterium]|nr:Gfo/Idh/MocA family oxidoreductase [Planctomycetaceae bacterium]
MPAASRRHFLSAATLGAAGLAVGSQQAVARSAADQVTLGVIGPGGMGLNHVRQLCSRSDVRIAAVCDVDEQRRNAAAEHVAKETGNRPQIHGDLRQLLDNADIDAVFIATPDHWHAPAAILALDAGKHVYVEKPCCHNIREGRLMADAVGRSGKRLQVGTQSRSTDCVREAIQRVHEGEIGDIIVTKAWNSQRRGSIGHTQPSQPPAHLDFDTWVGPAPMVPYRSNLLHGVWRWWYDFGCGDIGNDGVHDIDVAVWGLQPASHPERVTCLGGKYVFDDDQQFPDTQYAVCEYPTDTPDRRRQLIFEQRDWSPYVQEDYENGAAFYGTKGCLIIGHSKGWKLYAERNKLVAERTGGADLAAHHTNFLNCVRDASAQLNAPIDVGLLGAGIVHLANISARTRSVLEFDAATETITNNDQAASMVSRKYRTGHWSVPKS